MPRFGAAVKHPLDTLSGRPVFSLERCSQAPGYSQSVRRDVPIECRRSDAAVRDLGHADVGIGEHRLGGLDVVVREFRRTASCATNAARGGKACLSALPDQAYVRIPPMRQTCEKQADLARSSCRGLRSGCENRYLSAAVPRRFRSTASSSAPSGRASTHSACRRGGRIPARRARLVDPSLRPTIAR